MRILVISDLHANWPALEAVLAAEPFDRLVVGGDLISYGPHPREVVDLVRRRASVVVRGNHDDSLAHRVDCRCAPSTKPLAEATRALHRDLLSSEDVAFLADLPLMATFDAAGTRLFSAHATPTEPLHAYALTPAAPDDRIRAEIASVDADYILLGHTHLPMIRRVGSRVVVNPGSVGQPRDGDLRASYAVIDDGTVTLKRVPYDVERTIRALDTLPLDRAVTERLVAILRTGKT